MLYHLRKITNGKPGDYLINIPSQVHRLGVWESENGHAMEFSRKEAKDISDTIYRINNIHTRLEKVRDI